MGRTFISEGIFWFQAAKILLQILSAALVIRLAIILHKFRSINRNNLLLLRSQNASLVLADSVGSLAKILDFLDLLNVTKDRTVPCVVHKIIKTISAWGSLSVHFSLFVIVIERFIATVRVSTYEKDDSIITAAVLVAVQWASGGSLAVYFVYANKITHSTSNSSSSTIDSFDAFHVLWLTSAVDVASVIAFLGLLIWNKKLRNTVTQYKLSRKYQIVQNIRVVHAMLRLAWLFVFLMVLPIVLFTIAATVWNLWANAELLASVFLQPTIYAIVYSVIMAKQLKAVYKRPPPELLKQTAEEHIFALQSAWDQEMKRHGKK